MPDTFKQFKLKLTNNKFYKFLWIIILISIIVIYFRFAINEIEKSQRSPYKDFITADFEKTQSCRYTLRLTNNMNKTLKAYNGIVRLYDLFDKEVDFHIYEITETLDSHNSILLTDYTYYTCEESPNDKFQIENEIFHIVLLDNSDSSIYYWVSVLLNAITGLFLGIIALIVVFFTIIKLIQYIIYRIVVSKDN